MHKRRHIVAEPTTPISSSGRYLLSGDLKPDMSIESTDKSGGLNFSGSGVRDNLVRDVIRGLYEGRYEPGQRLQEARLTSAYGVSRGPVREALNMLSAMNIVDLVPQSGAQVRVLTLRDAIDTLIVAQTLIRLSARLAAESADAGAREKLEAALKALTSFRPDETSAAFAIARDTFYGAITTMAANSELSRLLPTVRVHLIRVQFRSLLRADDARRRADYSRIAAAILARNPAKADAAVRLHLGRAISLLTKAL